jgi:hypothetical protein
MRVYAYIFYRIYLIYLITILHVYSYDLFAWYVQYQIKMQ